MNISSFPLKSDQCGRMIHIAIVQQADFITLQDSHLYHARNSDAKEGGMWFAKGSEVSLL